MLWEAVSSTALTVAPGMGVSFGNGACILGFLTGEVR